MEPLSQALLGAAVGQVACGRELGRRAFVWGALIGMSPDLDVLLAPLHGGYGELLYHRGTTHSLWFGFVVGPLLGWLLWKWRDGGDDTLGVWRRLAIVALVTHPLLDVFTPYGTQLFAPFWRERFAFHGVGIVDPAYTLVLGGGVLVGWMSTLDPARMVRAGALALAASSTYLVAGVGLNEFARADARSTLGLGPSDEVRSYPTVLQPLFRRVVARSDGRVFVGWHTTMRPGCIVGDWITPPPEDVRTRDLRASWEGELMTWFALGDVIPAIMTTPDGTSVVSLEDLRYGTPSQRPGESMWGVRARYAHDGARVGRVTRFRRAFDERTGGGPLLAATLGDFQGLGASACR